MRLADNPEFEFRPDRIIDFVALLALLCRKKNILDLVGA